MGQAHTGTMTWYAGCSAGCGAGSQLRHGGCEGARGVPDRAGPTDSRAGQSAGRGQPLQGPPGHVSKLCMCVRTSALVCGWLGHSGFQPSSNCWKWKARRNHKVHVHLGGGTECHRRWALTIPPCCPRGKGFLQGICATSIASVRCKNSFILSRAISRLMPAHLMC